MLTEADQLKGPALIPGHDTILVLGARGHGATCTLRPPCSATHVPHQMLLISREPGSCND